MENDNGNDGNDDEQSSGSTKLGRPAKVPTRTLLRAAHQPLRVCAVCNPNLIPSEYNS
jgi:hypothetical protein